MSSKLFKAHEAAREKVEAPINKANKSALETGDAKVKGAGDEGKGTAGHAAAVHAEASKIIKGIKPVTR